MRTCWVVKRLWDETAIRVMLSEVMLLALMSGSIGEGVLAAKRRSKAKCVFPGYTMQSMQQTGFVRWDDTVSGGQELVISGAVVHMSIGLFA